MTAHIDPARIVGRDRETGLIRESLADLDRRGEALLVRGEAGIGKSELLAYTADLAAAEGIRFFRVAGVESESELPFAGLHQLLGPLVPGAERLPAPQRDALLAAFGAAARVSPSPQLFLVALGALNLLSEEAEATPLVLVVEDAHWLDSSSAAALAFIARRIESEPVLLVAAIRDGFPTGFDDAGLPELRLERLDEVDSAAVLDARAPSLAHQVRTRILEEAAGNPLALVELPLTPDPAPEPAELAPWVSLTARLEHAFSARAAPLDPRTRALLLVLAADEADAITEIIPAARLLVGDRVDVDDLTPAIDAGLIESDGARVLFRHPLMRSATYQSASIADRQAAHAALSDVVVDEDRRVWHLAAASIAPAGAVAEQLDAVAVRAQRRGAVSTGIVALERAAYLSETSARQGQRLLAAAELGFELGRDDIVARLVARAEALRLAPPAQSYLLWLRGVFDGGRAGGASRFDPLIETAGSLAGRAPDANDLAVKMLWSAAIQYWWSDPDRDISRRIVEAVGRIPIDAGDPRILAILAFAAPVERGATVMDGFSRAAEASLDPDAARILGTAANAIGAFDTAASLLGVATAGLRDQGRLGLLARGLTQQAWSAVHRVDLSVAVPVAEEAERLTRETAQPTMRHISRALQASTAALRGDREAAEEYAAEAERYGVPIGASALLAMTQHARGLGALADGDPDEAFEHLRRVHDPSDPAHHSFMRCFTVADLVDAATRSGRRDAVRPIVLEMEAVAEAAPVPVLHAGLRYARPLLAGDDAAEPLFDAALRANRGWPFLRARTQIALGEWLRRHRRVAESRPPLRDAREAFDALGAVPWGERARQELRASGQTSRSRTPEARDQLTPQELQIAQLAATGLSNQEIGQRLFISHRTVSTHLYRLYPKLGITSRSGLRDALGASSGDGWSPPGGV